MPEQPGHFVGVSTQRTCWGAWPCCAATGGVFPHLRGPDATDDWVSPIARPINSKGLVVTPVPFGTGVAGRRRIWSRGGSTRWNARGNASATGIGRSAGIRFHWPGAARTATSAFSAIRTCIFTAGDAVFARELITQFAPAHVRHLRPLVKFTDGQPPGAILEREADSPP